MLDPTGFSQEEANAAVGKQIVRVFERASGEKVDGRVGRIVAAEQVPHFHGNNYQFFVSVQWTNRDGSLSLPARFGKEQLEQHTRPLRIQEMAAAEHHKASVTQAKAKQAFTHQQNHRRSRRF